MIVRLCLHCINNSLVRRPQSLGILKCLLKVHWRELGLLHINWDALSQEVGHAAQLGRGRDENGLLKNISRFRTHFLRRTNQQKSVKTAMNNESIENFEPNW